MSKYQQYSRTSITKLQFEVLDKAEIEKKAVTELTVALTYDERGFLAPGGVLDPKLGITSTNQQCETCHTSRNYCEGHTGLIKLAYPVLHIQFMHVITYLLLNTCHNCGKVISRTASTICKNCDTPHRDYKLVKPYSFLLGDQTLQNEVILQHFEKIDKEDLKILKPLANLNIDPVNFIITSLPVLPVVSRPSLVLSGGRHSEDPLTHKYLDIVRTNNKIKKLVLTETISNTIYHFKELLQYHVSTLFNNAHKSLPVATAKAGKPIKSLTEKLKGKEGRFRQNLTGKRIDHSARAVVTPSLLIKPEQILVPLEIAKNITKIETINRYNLEFVKVLLANYPNYPTLTHVIVEGRFFKVLPTNLAYIAECLVVGNKIQRQMLEGDQVLINRHPSLHRFSMINHRVKLTNHSTLGLNPLTAAGYNADFDGDEMNLHLIQQSAAAVEAAEVMNMAYSTVADKNARVLVALCKELIAGAYLLSRAEKVYSATQTLYILSRTGLLAPKTRLTGKEILQLALGTSINFKQSNLEIINGFIHSGVLTKDHVGTQSSLLSHIHQMIGGKAYLDFIHTLAIICMNVLEVEGLSYSISYDILSYVEKNPESTEAEFITYVNTNHSSEGIVVLANSKAAGTSSSIIQNFYKIGYQSVPAETKLIVPTRELKKGVAVDYISNSFARGLDSEEYFLQTMAGRITLIDVFCRTSSTGYTSRKLNNCLQSLVIRADYSVRDHNNRIIQLVFGNKRLSIKKVNQSLPYINCKQILEPYHGSAKTNKEELREQLKNTSFAKRVEKVYLEGVCRYAELNGVASMHILQQESALIQFQENYFEDVGTPIGLVSAQALAEPLTQMTLHRRHDIGDTKKHAMASSFEAIHELLMATKTLKVPFVKISFDKSNIHKLEQIKQRIQTVMLKNISTIFIDSSALLLKVKVDLKALKTHSLTINNIVVKLSKIKSMKVRVINDAELQIQPVFKVEDSAPISKFYNAYTKITQLMLKGKRETKEIHEEKVSAGNTNLYVINGDFAYISGILASAPETYEIETNDISAVNAIYGLPTAKRYLLTQILNIIKSQGLTIDVTHLRLLIDTMCYSGVIKGFNRAGVMAENNSTIAKASFEIANKVLVNAALRKEYDILKGPFEATVIGKYAQIGTELVSMKLKTIHPWMAETCA